MFLPSKIYGQSDPALVEYENHTARVRQFCHNVFSCSPFFSRQDLGTAMGVKRGSLMVLIREHGDYADLYGECKDEIEKQPVPTSA